MSKSKVIKAVIFDVDGVLVDSKKANVALFQTLLKRAGYPPATEEEILSHFHLPLWQSLEKLTKSNDQDEIKRIWEMARDPTTRNPELFDFPEQLEDVLEQLHKKYKLAIVTSRIKAGMDDIFSTKEIKHLFDVVVVFEDYKNPKPHPEPLLLAVKRLGISVEEAIYIGDSKTDVEAAMAAGMKVIYIAAEPHPDASKNIAEFNELLEAIDGLI